MPTTKVFAKAGLDNVTSDMYKHQQLFGLDVQCSALVHNFNNIFSNEHLHRAGQSMNPCLRKYSNVSGYFMMKLRNFIIALFGLFLLTQCNSKEDSGKRTPASFSVTTQHENYLNGQWRYSIPFYYSDLVLHDNGTFTFHDQGCYGQRFSQGHWTNENDTIQLTSFETFKKLEQAEKSITNDTDQKKTSDEYSFAGLKKVPPPVLPGPNDTIRVYLDKVRLQLAKDTLFCIGSNRLPEDAKFHKTKNNR